jgi:hypothetical protein
MPIPAWLVGSAFVSAATAFGELAIGFIGEKMNRPLGRQSCTDLIDQGNPCGIDTAPPIDPVPETPKQIPIPYVSLPPIKIYSHPDRDPFAPLDFAVDIAYPPDVPNRRLPTEDELPEDPSTRTTPVKTIKVNVASQSRRYGGLLHEPVTKQKLKVNQVKESELVRIIDPQQKAATAKFIDWLLGRPQEGTKITDTALCIYRFTSSEIDTPSLTGPLIGTEILNKIADEYRKRANLHFPVRSTIATEVETIEFEQSPEQVGNFEGIGIGQTSEVWDLLGGTNFLNDEVKLPETLLTYTDAKEPVTLKNYPDVIQWIITQFDALLGQFPIKINIKDIDPTTQGEQSKTVELSNVSESLAEMYGLLIQSAVSSDISVSMLMHLASDLISTKAATMITQDYVKANASYLGYRGSSESREVDFAFDPSNLESLESIMKPTKQKLVGWKNEEKESVQDYLQRLMFAASIIKNTHFSKDGNALDEVMKNLKGGETPESKAAWDEFIATVNNEASILNNRTVPQPKINDL